MTISKHLHSCLFIREENINVLIDPGNFTFEEKGLGTKVIKSLDYLLITHNHTDHMYTPFIKEIIKKFPQVVIISNISVVNILKKEGIKAHTQSRKNIEMVDAPHEKIFWGKAPQNTLFNIFNKLTHPGDSLHFDSSKEILALPVQAPWGSLTQAVEKALDLKPKVIIPIHDWHWNKKARETFYKRLTSYFGQFGISFKALSTGEKIVI